MALKGLSKPGLLNLLVVYVVWSSTYLLLPIHVTMTYGFVNPVLAVVLGWAILHETVGLHTLAGAVLVIMGVAGVFLTRINRGRTPQSSQVKTAS